MDHLRETEATRSQGGCAANPHKTEDFLSRARSSNWIEQGTPKPKVGGSIPPGRTITRTQ